ncbi:MAG: hypothetical protein AAFU85_18725 [Planctomycetota bacterium]
MVTRLVVMSLALLVCLTASAQTISKEDQQEMRKMSGRFMAVQQLLQDPKAAEEFGLDAGKRQRVQVAIQKFTDAMQRASVGRGRSFDMDAYRKGYEKLMSSVDAELTAEQRSELTKRGEDQLKKFPSGNNQSQEQMQEMQRMQSIMSELQKLSYDVALAESIGLTVEQRVEIREASQKFMRAMQALQKPGQASFDMEKYNQLIGDLVIEAQGILTLEQAKKMSLNAKINRLKSQHGDVFGVVNGLAEEFELSKTERKELRESILDARQDYYEELKRLREETLERILRQLPAAYREEVRTALEGQLKSSPQQMRGLPSPKEEATN